jgi:hypothetical protein
MSRRLRLYLMGGTHHQMSNLTLELRISAKRGGLAA